MLVLVYLLAVLFSFYCIILLKRKEKRIILSFDNTMIIFVVILWGIVFPLTYSYSYCTKFDGVLASLIKTYSVLEIMYYYFIVYIFIFCFVRVYRTKIVWKRKQYLNKSCWTKQNEKIFDNSVLLLLFIGILADFLYLRAYGGYFNYLEYSSLLRSGILIVSNKWSFLLPVRDCVILSTYLLIAKFFSKKMKSKVLHLILLFAIIESIAILYSNKGRLSMIIFFFVIFIYIIKKYITKINIKFIFTSILVLLAFVFFTVQVSRYMNREIHSDLLLGEIAFVFSNFKVLLNNITIDGYRIFVDLLNFPMFLLPSSLWRKFFNKTASDVMTILVYGFSKGTGNVHGEIPVDMISLGFLQFNIIGIVVVSSMFALLMKIIFTKILSIKNDSIKNMLSIYIAIELGIRSVIYADPYNIVQRMLPFVIFIILYTTLNLTENLIKNIKGE